MCKKLEAIKRINNGESLEKIALEFGVGETTVFDWRRNKAQIKAFCSKMDSSKAFEGRSTLKKAKIEKFDEAVYLWFKQQRAQDIPISGNILKGKTFLHSQKLNENESFSANQGEKLFANKDSAKDFVERFEEVIEKENLTLDQIYNADETGLFYRMMPLKSLASKEEASAPGYKKSKRCCFLFAQMLVELIPLLLIGKSKKPRSFKNINVNSLPVKYRNQRSAWVNSEIFEKWFHDDFVPHVKQHLAQPNLPPKAVLRIDNAPCHPEEEMLTSGEIRVIFLPANVTSLIQPMDQGVIKAKKRHYEKKLISHILECEENLNEALKKKKM
ncbi:Jerky -like [Araneus ventricosus]|uniref:Jerky-like n=1 Tax=Araneus ventricosus TaxID=182803 RepID=A0A4Y2A7L5_ARAVE|nr:Jerky -like [Araneus ventricosus]